MKRYSFFALLIVVLLSSCDKETLIEADKLPKDIREYINDHFPDVEVLHAMRERDGIERTFEVSLSNRVMLEFKGKNKIVEIDGESQLPDSVIPSSIRSYVQSNYPEKVITDWELDDGSQKIELNNTLELVFSDSGVFLGTD